jgi:poly-gamma-glutamate synthesis protein (capsule biosynthesis protein)
MSEDIKEKKFLTYYKYIILFSIIFIFAYIFPKVFVQYFAGNNSLARLEERIDLNKRITASVLDARNEVRKDDEGIKVAFVGDIMLDRGVYNKIVKKGAGDFNFAFANIKNDLKKYDLLVGNLEGPVSDKGIDKHDLYSFRMDPQILPVLKDLGFGVLSIANNHIDNWGLSAIEDTISRLSSSGIQVVGGGMNSQESYAPVIINTKGLKIALLSFSEFGAGQYESGTSTAGISVISEQALKRGIELARKSADIVVVIFHFGEEYKNTPTEYQKKYAHMAVSLGANLVVGHHPHIVEPIEYYKNTYIAYSLGNFIFDQYFSPETMQGGLLELEIKNKSIVNINLRTVQMNSDYQPALTN